MPTRVDRNVAFALLLVTFALAFDALRPVASYDAWFHVATGREIWAQGGPLRVDSFSSTHAGQPWPWQDGLADLIMAAFAQAGAGGLVLFKALCFAGTVALLGLSLARARVPAGVLAAGIAAAAGGLSFRMLERPESLGYLMLAWLLLELDHWRRERGEGRSCGHRPWRVLGIVWLNAQLHRGAVILPLVLLAFAVATQLESGKVKAKAAAGASDWRAWAFVPLSALLLLCTPYGGAIFKTSNALMSDYVAMHEFTAPSLELLWGLTPWTLFWIPASLVAVLVLVRRGVSEHLWELACLLMGLVLLSRGLRFAAYLPVFALIPLARAWPASWAERSGWVGMLAAAALMVGVLRSPLPGPKLGVEASHHPTKGVAFVRAERAKGNLGGPLFNTSAYGGYLLSELDRDLRVYVDGRVDLVYSPAFMRTSAQAMVDPQVFSAEHTRWDFDWIFIDNAPQRRDEAHFDLHPEFGLVHMSTRALVYVRKRGPDAKLWQEQGYQIIKPHFIAQSVEAGLANPQTQARTIAEVLRMVDDDPDNPVAKVAHARLRQGGLVAD